MVLYGGLLGNQLGLHLFLLVGIRSEQLPLLFQIQPKALLHLLEDFTQVLILHLIGQNQSFPPPDSDPGVLDNLLKDRQDLWLY
jgi:hypothetical protein